MISLSAAVSVIVFLVVAGIIFGLLNWLIDAAPMDGKFKQFAKFALIALAVMVLIGFLLSFVNGTPIFRS